MTTIYKFTSEGHIEKSVAGTRTILGEEREVVTKTLIKSDSEEYSSIVEEESITVEPYDADSSIAKAEALQASKDKLTVTLYSMTLELDDERTIQCRVTDYLTLSVGIETGATRWKMLDNEFHDVTTEELATALAYGKATAKAAWELHETELEAIKEQYSE